MATMIALAASGSAILMLRGARSLQVEQAANRLMLAARTARVTAIQRGEPQHLVLDEAGRRFFITTEIDESQAAAGETVGMSHMTTMAEGVTFEKVGVLGAGEEMLPQVIFQPNGSAQAALIQIGNGTHHATVTILEATGRVKLQEGIAENMTLDWIDLDEEETR